MKNFFQKVVNLYAANGKFHALVISTEFALVGFVTNYTGGLPTSKDGWAALGAGLAGAAWGALKGWLRTNVAQ